VSTQEATHVAGAGAQMEEWTREQVTAWLAEQGRPCAPATWSSYVTRAGAPKPYRHVGRTPLWDAQAVREWHARRAGQGWRASAQNGGQP
jgi:hypothetical protein